MFLLAKAITLGLVLGFYPFHFLMQHMSDWDYHYLLWVTKALLQIYVRWSHFFRALSSSVDSCSFEPYGELIHGHLQVHLFSVKRAKEQQEKRQTTCHTNTSTWSRASIYLRKFQGQIGKCMYLLPFLISAFPTSLQNVCIERRKRYVFIWRNYVMGPSLVFNSNLTTSCRSVRKWLKNIGVEWYLVDNKNDISVGARKWNCFVKLLFGSWSHFPLPFGKLLLVSHAHHLLKS